MLRRSSLIACLALAPLLLGSASCPPQGGVQPPWHVELWAGDSASAGFRRTQAQQFLACSDPAIDDMFAAKYEALVELQEILASCKQWDPAVLAKFQALEQTLKEVPRAHVEPAQDRDGAQDR